MRVSFLIYLFPSHSSILHVPIFAMDPNDLQEAPPFVMTLDVERVLS